MENHNTVALSVSAVLAVAAILSTNSYAEDDALKSYTAQYQSIAQERVINAVVEAVNRSTVSAETSGRVTEISFDIGDTVKAGSVLIRITQAEQQSELAAAQASVDEAQARLNEAQLEFERIEGVFRQKLVAKSALDKAAADLKAAQQRFNASEAKLKQARERLQYTVVRAPYSGLVVERHVDLGEMVAPGKPVMTGLSLEKLRVAAQVPQSLATLLDKNTVARIILPPLKNRDIESVSLNLSPQADAVSHTFLVRAGLPKGTVDVLPGMFAKIAFVVGEKRALLIPESALVRRSELTAVYVITAQQRIAFRQVRVGRHHDNQVEILAGLEDGERVALDPILAGIRLKEQRKNGTTQAQTQGSGHE